MQGDLRAYVKQQVLEQFHEISGNDDQPPLSTERLDKICEGEVYTVETPPPPTLKKERPPVLKYLGSWNKTRRQHDIGRQHKRNKAAKKSRKINRK